MSDHLKYIIIECGGSLASMLFNPIIEHKKAAVGVCGVSGVKSRKGPS